MQGHYSGSHGGLVDLPAPIDEEEPALDGTRNRWTDPISTADVKQTISEMKQRLLQFEMKLASSSSNVDHAGANGETSISDSAHDARVMFQNHTNVGFNQQQFVPKMCDKSWSDFMNKDAEESSEYAIEILVGEPDYHRPKKATEKPDKRSTKSRNLRSDAGLAMDSKSQELVAEESSIPERIRINSPWILNTLTSIDKTLDATGPIVMLRPYKFLIHYERQIRESISLVQQETYGHEKPASDHPYEESLHFPSTSSNELPAASQDTEHRRLTVLHMTCLIDFINQYIKPTVTRFENSVDGKIRFRDLWYIFKPGDDILMPLRHPRGRVSFDAVITAPEMFQSRYNMIWRVTGTGGGRINLSNAQSRNGSLKINAFKVNCYYIDFDGKFFCPIIHTFSIMPFKGEQDITSLDFFPFRFLKEAQNTMKKHLDAGNETFKKITTFTHYYYVGPTLVVQPCGCPVQKEPLHQEHVESEIIVDFKTTLIKHPNWRPKPFVWQIPPVERRELQEKTPVRYWNDMTKGKLEHAEHDHIYDDYYIDNERATIFKNNEPIFEPVPSGWLINESMVPERDLLLMPGRVFAFILRTRTFGRSILFDPSQLNGAAAALTITQAPLWLWLLQPIEPQLDGLRNLQLRDDSFKDIIQALVRTHFMQKNTRQASDFEYDVVRGKGDSNYI